MFANITIAPVSSNEVASRLVLAVACTAAMIALAVSPAIAAGKSSKAATSCSAVSAQAATFARVQLGVTKTC
jgi:uncharacterized membrane protein